MNDKRVSTCVSGNTKAIYSNHFDKDAHENMSAVKRDSDRKGTDKCI